MIWPDFFPDGCPTDSAKAASGQFFRVVPDRIGRTLKEKHFLSHRESQRNRQWPPDVNECDLCSVSLMQDIEDAKKHAMALLNAIPAYRNRVGRIAYGVLEPSCGKIKHTPDFVNGYISHHDWWCYADANATNFFQFTEIVVERL